MMESHALARLIALSLLAPVCLYAPAARADNPIVQHMYTADPAPLVYDETVYLYTSHDEDVTVNDFFTMNDWLVFSSKDMVNWTDHGSPLSYQSFSWATGKAWAPHCIERNGKFYMYVPVSDAIGVAVADSPTGPFEDAIGAPLMSNYQYIDPTVFIDDDGQAYLYFGNPKLWYVRLNEDMISYSGQIQEVPQTAEAFGQRTGDPDRPTLYEEGPWFYKRNDLYYLVYPAGGIPEDIAYSTSPGPTGPWTYRGTIMENTAGHAFTNHPGVVDYKGRSFFFYHTQELPGGGGFKRSVAVEEFSYGADGSIPTINKTSQGPDAVDNLNPYQRVEGETIAWATGIEVEDSEAGGRSVAQIDDGDTIKVKSVDFRTGAISFEASVASAGGGGSIELHLDRADGPLIATCPVEPTGGWQMWATVSCEVSDAAEVHDLFFVFRGGNGSLFNLDWWQFTPLDPLPTGMGGMGGMGGVGGASTTGDGVTSGGSGGDTAAVGTTGNTSSATTGSVGGAGGSVGTGPAGTMTTSGNTSTSGSGTASGLGGTGAATTSPTNPQTPASPGEDGCACRTKPGRSSSGLVWPGVLLTLLHLRQARRRRLASSAMG